MLLMLAMVAAAASPEDPRVWVGAGLAGGVGAASVPGGGGGAAVYAGVSLAKDPRHGLGLFAKVREGVFSGDLREIGNIGGGLRYPAGVGPWVAVGFAHNHEALVSEFLQEPVQVTAGISSLLTHRTGAELGLGWDFAPPFPDSRFGHRFSVTTDVAATWFPDKGGPPVYALAEVGVRIGLDGLFTRPQ
jgi:hypothetical protein